MAIQPFQFIPNMYQFKFKNIFTQTLSKSYKVHESTRILSKFSDKAIIIQTTCWSVKKRATTYIFSMKSQIYSYALLHIIAIHTHRYYY